MPVKGIKIAIISDLHCHPTNAGGQESYFLSDLPNTPIYEHPVESLLELIDKEGIEVDFLLVPGDLTNRINPQGFTTAWEAVKKISDKLKAKKCVATIGNHDVDSRAIEDPKPQSHPEDPFHLARTLCQTFPVEEEDSWNEYWAKGFCFIESEDTRILNINSCFFHINKKESERGNFSKWQLERLKVRLENLAPKKFLIAMCHHHPQQHEHSDLGSEDLMKNGSNLITLLNEFKFNIIIHGHKHDPFLSYSQGGSNSMPVFSSGSFSVLPDRMLQDNKNTFHLLEIDDSKISSCINQGTITTYSFLYKKGWELADKVSKFFPTYTGFGCRTIIPDLANETQEWMNKQNKETVRWDELMKVFPKLKYLVPSDLLEYSKILKKDFQLECIPEPPYMIKILGKKASL